MTARNVIYIGKSSEVSTLNVDRWYVPISTVQFHIQVVKSWILRWVSFFFFFFSTWLVRQVSHQIKEFTVNSNHRIHGHRIHKPKT